MAYIATAKNEKPWVGGWLGVRVCVCVCVGVGVRMGVWVCMWVGVWIVLCLCHTRIFDLNIISLAVLHPHDGYILRLVLHAWCIHVYVYV